MASTIKSIPILKADAAERFLEKTTDLTQKKHSIDFSKQVKTASAILKKSKL